MSIKVVSAIPFDDQNPGTSGLRKKVSVFENGYYTHNFIQSIFNTVNASGKTIVIGGDGRYFSKKAIDIILKIASANGVKKVFVGKDGLFSTPAISNFIRSFKLDYGIILSASHNPGGKDGDFGIKLNISNGSPAPENITRQIFEHTKNIKEFLILDTNEVIDLSIVSVQHIGKMEVEVVDSVEHYAILMQKIFDMDLIRSFLRDKTFIFDAMNAVSGIYAIKIFSSILGVDKSNILNSIPLEDFGGIHPDPCPVYADKFYDMFFSANPPFFGAASDGDADRNMIMGAKTFVSPSDSLAILTEYLHIIPYYKNSVVGVARSMPTSSAVDRVAKSLGIDFFEVPTGWKYFGNLLSASKITLCGEESFGTGSSHILEKDGIWATLAWLNILAYTKSSPQKLLEEHWAKFGRTYHSRHDYDIADIDKAKTVYNNFYQNALLLKGKSTIGLPEIIDVINFEYKDTIDGSIITNQGYIVKTDSYRIILRISGTGTMGATLRFYYESFDKEPTSVDTDVQKKLSKQISLGIFLSKISEVTGLTKPSLIV